MTFSQEKVDSVMRGEKVAAFIFTFPSLMGLGIFYVIPFLDTIRRSFFNARGTKFIGFSGYTSVFTNEAFKLSCANTAKFISICIPLLLGVSLILALFVRLINPHAALFKTSYLLPMAIPVASLVLLWQVVFRSNGLINSTLKQLNVEQVDFMNGTAVFWVLIATYIFKNSGYNMILWLAGLDSISQTLYEAAKADGAGAWKCFLYITFPSLYPTIGLVTIMSLLNSFKVFREAYLVAGSYPPDSIYLLQHLFNNWFQNLDITRLCATAVLLCAALIGLILFILQMFTSKSE